MSIKVEEISLNEPHLRVTITIKGKEVQLTPQEMAIFNTIYIAKGQPVTRKVIYASMLYGTGETYSNCVDVFIWHLRQKLGPKAIKTIRGVGYCLGDLR